MDTELDPVSAAKDVVKREIDDVLDSDLALTAELVASSTEGSVDNAIAFGPPGAASDHGWRAVRAALEQKGMREARCGNNSNPFSRYFGYGPQFWCADFVSWAFDATGNRDRKVPWGYPSGVAGIVTWGRRTGNLSKNPRPGSIFAYLDGRHTGLVVRLEAGRFLTIEGNTSGPDGKVCWVWTHARVADGRYGFITVPD